MLLDDFSFRDTPLRILNAYSAEEAKVILKKEAQIAVIILDISMEKTDSGLKLAEYIRGELENLTIQIIIFSGYDQQFKEMDILEEYDINSYLSKTQISRHKLMSMLKSSIRMFEHLENIEKKVREADEKFQLLANYTNDWEYWIDTKGHFKYVSPACEIITGYAPEKFMNDSLLFMSCIWDEYKEEFRNYLKSIGDPQVHLDNYEFKISCSNDHEKWLIHKSSPIFNSSGQYLGQRGNIRDITIRKSAELELRKVLMALTQAPISIVITDKNAKIEYVNPFFQDITGYTLEESIGKNPSILKSGKIEQDYYEKLWQTLESKNIWRGEFCNKKKNGTFYWESATISPVMDDNGNITHYLGLKEDISYQKELEEKEKQLQSQLIHSNKMASLGVLSAGLAHEVNNPNNFILYNSELIKDIWNDVIEKVFSTLPQDDSLKITGYSIEKISEIVSNLLFGISEGSERIRRITNSLKEFSRQDESETLSLQKSKVNEIIENAIVILNFKIKSKTNNLWLELGDNIPDVYWNKQKIEQVIINILENALESLPDRINEVTIKSKYIEKTQGVSIECVDEGIGIEKSIIGKVMEPFYTTRANRGGTGLGLSISYSIIKEHKGSIDITSKKGIGTRVVITLPINPNEQ